MYLIKLWLMCSPLQTTGSKFWLIWKGRTTNKFPNMSKRFWANQSKMYKKYIFIYIYSEWVRFMCASWFRCPSLFMLMLINAFDAENRFFFLKIYIYVIRMVTICSF